MKKAALFVVLSACAVSTGCVDMSFHESPFQPKEACKTGFIRSVNSSCDVQSLADETCYVMDDGAVCVAYVPDTGRGDGINCEGGYVTVGESETDKCTQEDSLTEEEIDSWEYTSESYICKPGSISGRQCRKVPDDNPSDEVFPILSGQRCTEEQRNPSTDTLRVHIIDVGNGDSIWIQTPTGQNVLIDGGDLGAFGVTAAGPIVTDYLSTHGFETGKKFDAVFLTHPHADHFGGFTSIFKKYGLKNYIDPMSLDTSEDVPASYTTWINTMKGKVDSLEHVYMPAKDKFSVNRIMPDAFFGPQVKAEYIFSRNAFVSANGDNSNPNTASIIFKLTYGGRSFIFTGDATTVDESSAIDEAKRADIDMVTNFLKVCHHGSSKTSSSPAFFDAIWPGKAAAAEAKDRGAFISTGRRLYSGSPTMDKETIDRIHDYIGELNPNFLSTGAGDTQKNGDINAIRDDNILVVVKSTGEYYACYSGTN